MSEFESDRSTVTETLGDGREVPVVASSINPLGSSSNISIRNARTSINPLGEIVLRWSVSSSDLAPETFIICCSFGSYFAPVGAVPAVLGVRKYRFVDHVLNAYVGKKTYSIVVVFANGAVKTFESVASAIKNSSVPRELYQ
ncbi:MAG: hypothetical protein CMA72_09450 [Euryarchaeota archaeon]|nr:hypothetical protein [Euryarchaeota archaeon]|tara:strand:+ start:7049 stop:7474 length:426 start_codon:yes stop_codon:yes gene_type:complete